ncbi:MAG: GMC oxidoreductase [Actinomycetales bacterium]
MTGRAGPADGRAAGRPDSRGDGRRDGPGDRPGDVEVVDVVVVGSGFGGSVAALRLSEKGYRVLVLEAGRRWADADHARTSWDLPRFLWAPRLGWYGIQRIHRLPHVVILAGAGVGGGSLNYANTLYRPPPSFFRAGSWAGAADWEAELAPHYVTAERMLGAVTSPFDGTAERVMRDTAEALGVGHTFRSTPVGVFLGARAGQGDAAPGQTVPDPLLGGEGPARTACTACGNCMVGCRVGAKNTLLKNYLYLAERRGAEIRPLRTVTRVERLVERGPGGDGSGVSGRGGGNGDGDVAGGRPRWRVTHRRTGAPGLGAWRRDERTVLAHHVVLAAGAWGTAGLLQRMRATGVLPDLPPALGTLTRTNSEALLGVATRRVPPGGPAAGLTHGVAITSSFHPDADTHVENVRYGPGSNAMGMLAGLLVDGDGRGPRWLRAVGRAVTHPGEAVRSRWVRRWSERTVIALVMQTRDNSLTVSARPRIAGLLGGWAGWRLTSRQGHGEPNPSWIPAGHAAVREMRGQLTRRTGVPVDAFGSAADAVNVPMTAHFLGGCPIGTDPATSVLDPRQQVWGHPGLHVLDGSAVSANLGVNPSLTITAQAERACALWPAAGSVDGTAAGRVGGPPERAVTMGGIGIDAG